ncbi:hypothetical protein [Kribbella catacumbae]|uniref:hypothetical protein n=1 Tax=Kribbella catacumbae TaxID=460086 RepID=UPI0012F87A7A|nr:hypothetical protein [Kribbella catacumbae]
MNEGHTWEFAGRQRPVGDDGDPVAHAVDLDRCTATDLQAALRRSSTQYNASEQLWVSELLGPDDDVEDGPVGPVSFTLTDGHLTLRFPYSTFDYINDDPELFQHTEQILAPLLNRHRMWLVSAEQDESRATAPWAVWVEIGFHSRARRLTDLVDVGLDALALLDAVENGNLGRDQIADLLRGGHAEALVGQAEGPWLEAKRQHYDLSSSAGKISLAQAVARFANAEQGGLVVVGLETKGVAGQDVIRKITPMPHDPRVGRKYRQILEHRLYPPVDGLQIEAITRSDGDLVLIDIPPQPDELKPFLVHGAVIDSRTEGAFISIVRRRGDSSIPTTAAMIHAHLAAGRALLRRGELTSPPAD